MSWVVDQSICCQRNRFCRLNDLVETTPEQLDRFINQLNALSAQLEDADLDPEQALEVNQLFELLSQEVDVKLRHLRTLSCCSNCFRM